MKPVYFYTRLSKESDFVSEHKHWLCPVLKIPGAEIDKIIVRERVLSVDDYERLKGQDIIRWKVEEVPDRLLVLIVLKQKLYSFTQVTLVTLTSALIGAAGAIIAALISQGQAPITEKAISEYPDSPLITTPAIDSPDLVNKPPVDYTKPPIQVVSTPPEIPVKEFTPPTFTIGYLKLCTYDGELDKYFGSCLSRIDGTEINPSKFSSGRAIITSDCNLYETRPRNFNDELALQETSRILEKGVSVDLLEMQPFQISSKRLIQYWIKIKITQ